MGYFLRVLTGSATCPGLDVFHAAIAEQLPGRRIMIWAAEHEGDWNELQIRSEDGAAAFCVVTRDRVGAAGPEQASLAAEEIEEFRAELEEAKPASAAAWLNAYLDGVQTVYAVQMLPADEADQDGFTVSSACIAALRGVVGGIVQADGEGFSNEDGAHILWQFADDVSGPWTMAVREGTEWATFRMDLGDARARAAFLRGTIPPGAERV